MRPLMNDAIAAEASLMAAASFEMVSFCMSSSSTLMLWAFSAEGMMKDEVWSVGGKDASLRFDAEDWESLIEAETEASYRCLSGVSCAGQSRDEEQVDDSMEGSKIYSMLTLLKKSQQERLSGEAFQERNSRNERKET